jgi:NADH-quinone oxidoreductase subunit A
MHPYLPLLVYALVALAIPVGMSLVGTSFGKRKPEGAKYLAYESGHPTAPNMGRFPAKFYLVAMMFVIFDVEAVAMYPWAILLRDLGAYGLWVMLPLLIAFIIGDLYVWKKGGFEWR